MKKLIRAILGLSLTSARIILLRTTPGEKA